MVALHRYYNGTDHFYTTDTAEINEESAYAHEGVAGYVFATKEPGTVPVYRYYNGEDHFYTIDFNELGNGRSGYALESSQAFYVFEPNLNDPGLLKRVQDLFPNDPDRLFTFHGQYRGESTARKIDVL